MPTNQPLLLLQLQALFNVVIAWSVMLGPLMFADRKAANVQRKWPLYIGTAVTVTLLPALMKTTKQALSPSAAGKLCVEHRISQNEAA